MEHSLFMTFTFHRNSNKSAVSNARFDSCNLCWDNAPKFLLIHLNPPNSHKSVVTSGCKFIVTNMFSCITFFPAIDHQFSIVLGDSMNPEASSTPISIFVSTLELLHWDITILRTCTDYLCYNRLQSILLVPQRLGGKGRKPVTQHFQGVFAHGKWGLSPICPSLLNFASICQCSFSHYI